MPSSVEAPQPIKREQVEFFEPKGVVIEKNQRPDSKDIRVISEPVKKPQEPAPALVIISKTEIPKVTPVKETKAPVPAPPSSSSSHPANDNVFIFVPSKSSSDRVPQRAVAAVISRQSSSSMMQTIGREASVPSMHSAREEDLIQMILNSDGLDTPH